MAELCKTTLLGMLEYTASERSEKAAVVSDKEELTFGQLAGSAKMLGACLAGMTDKPVIALFLPMSGGFVTAFFGGLYANKAVLPLNMLLPPEELVFILQDAGVDLLVTSKLFASRLEKLPVKVVALENVIQECAAAGGEKEKKGPTPERPQPDDVCLYLYTSGTTGKPKGVELTHWNLASNCQGAIAALGLEDDCRVLACLPTFHTFAITATMLAPILVGGSIVPLPRFDPSAVLQLIEKQGCTILMMIPSMYRLVVRQQQRQPHKIQTVKIAVAGGEKLPDDLADSFESVFGIPLLEGYGQTESSPVVGLNAPQAHKKGTIGKPIVGVEVKIVDLETMTDQPVGETGEIWTRGPHVMKGYHNRPEETARVITEDGWLRTGDVGCVDQEGYVRITGREREMIKVAGEMVFPAEVEAVLLKHPAVFEAGVIGVTDPKRGEAVKAFVALKEGAQVDADELLKHCREGLPVYKVPRSIEFRDELPKGPTGKVMRRLLKDQ